MHRVDVGMLLRDLRSIKVGSTVRKRIDILRERFDANDLSLPDSLWLLGLRRRYRRQFGELYEARERALRTNGRRAMGLTTDDVKGRAEARERHQRELQNDFGI